jgi:hypothetical protein
MATGTMGTAGPGRGGRMSRQRKRDAVLRLLRGEDLEIVSRSLGVTAATLTAWRGNVVPSALGCVRCRVPLWIRSHITTAIEPKTGGTGR